jgi:hypothetical protein
MHKRWQMKQIHTIEGETHENTPDTVTAFTPEVVAAINMTLTLDGMDLFHLPSFVHRHPAICL